MGRTAAWVLSLAAVFAGAASAGCGGDGGGGAALAHGENVRSTLTTILVAAAKDDVASAAPHLAIQEFSGLFTESKPKAVDQLTPAERADLTSACFRQAMVVPNQSTLRDQVSISAALAAGTTTVHERIRKAEVAFDGPRAEGAGGPLHYVANFTLGTDNRWRLVKLEERFR